MGIGHLLEPRSAVRTLSPSRKYADRIERAVAAGGRPLTAHEVFTELRGDEKAPGLATVYRALHALVVAGVLHTIRLPDEIAYRRCGSGEHDHLVCEGCGAVAEIPRSLSSSWFDTSIWPDFAAPDHAVQLEGLCLECGR